MRKRFNVLSAIARSWLLLALISYSTHAVSKDVLDSSIDAYVHEQMTSGRIPGLALAVICHGHLEKQSVYGMASVELQVPVSANTLFHVASVTKSFTSVAVMTLVEAGQLRLTDAIGDFLPDLPPVWRNIKIFQLLNHTSGLPEVLIDPDESLASVADTAAGAIEILRQRPMQFDPGSRWRYNQTNFMLLALLIEKISGESLEQSFAHRLFAPLGLSTAVLADAATLVAHRATHYTILEPRPEAGQGPVPLKLLDFRMARIVYPAGGLNLSIAEFAQWVRGLMSGKLITQASLEALWTPAQRNDGSLIEEPPGPFPWKVSGRGWMLIPDAQHPVAGHSGGARASFMIFPKDQLAVIVLTNLQGAQPDRIADAIARKYLPCSR